MKNAIEVMLHRRSIRAFSEEDIERGILEKVLEPGLYAANACNEQACRLIAITDKAIIAELKELVYREFSTMEIIPEKMRERTIRKARNNPNFDFMYHAPALILAIGPKKWIHSMADCASMLQNIQNAADAYDLGSCWVNQIRWLDEDDLPELRSKLSKLGVSDEESVFGSLAIGHISGKYPLPAPRREGRITFY